MTTNQYIVAALQSKRNQKPSQTKNKTARGYHNYQYRAALSPFLSLPGVYQCMCVCVCVCVRVCVHSQLSLLPTDPTTLCVCKADVQTRCSCTRGERVTDRPAVLISVFLVLQCCAATFWIHNESKGHSQTHQRYGKKKFKHTTFLHLLLLSLVGFSKTRFSWGTLPLLLDSFPAFKIEEWRGIFRPYVCKVVSCELGSEHVRCDGTFPHTHSIKISAQTLKQTRAPVNVLCSSGPAAIFKTNREKKRSWNCRWVAASPIPLLSSLH